MDEIVTYFSSHKSQVIRPVNLGRVLLAFREGRFAAQIEKVRTVLEQEGEAAYKAVKKELPAIAFCGEFAGGHAKSNLVRYNNLLVFDIDHLTLDEMKEAKVNLTEDKYILAFWVSPSGKGYKGLIRINYHHLPENVSLDARYKKAFSEATDYFMQRFRISLDTNCSDYSRICYVCWDKQLYMNNQSVPFEVDCSDLIEEDSKKKPSMKRVVHQKVPTVIKPINVPGKNAQHDRNIISSILKYLTKRNLSITYTYDEWLRVGFAIANTFNYDLGKKYYLALSKLDQGKYDETACVEKLQECYMKGNGEITLGTIVEMARKKGYKGSSEDL